MTNPRELFHAKIDKLMELIPRENKIAAWADINNLLDSAPVGSPAEVGRFVGPGLKAIEAKYIQAPPSLSKAQKLLALRDASVLNDEEHLHMSMLLNEPGAGRCIESAYGQLEKTREGCNDKTLLVAAYTQVKGYFFEQSRIRIARQLAGTKTRTPQNKTRIKFRGLAPKLPLESSQSTTDFEVEVDNDVPIIPGRIWETKWYPRKNYGADHHAVNQLLKYQAAVDQGVFEAGTIEIHGNIDPKFLQNVCEGRQIAPGLELFCPDIEVLYALDESTSFVLKPGRHQMSMARGPKPAAFSAGDRNYESFDKYVITTRYANVDSGAGTAAFVDPELITDVAEFRLYEERVRSVRKKLWGLGL